ncbi:MAG: ATP-dependent Clp protease adaptor ClpS [Deltaproteobacteria bacterium]|nr:ATP-dependent Clp protease adaptor ClpS [Deltaproteobacteria bacterium]
MTIPTDPKFTPDSEILTDVELREPRHFRVLLHNDDYTTMDFVVEILCTIFHKTQDEAVKIMLAVHEKGRGDCGVYPAEVAETKVSVVHGRARAAGFPLRCSLEEV